MRKNGGMVLMMRHADVYDNPGTTRRLYGNLDGFWLSQLGVRQAMDAGKFLRKLCRLDVVIHSPLERTEQTARIVIDHNLGEPKRFADSALLDIIVPPWQGKVSRSRWTKHRKSFWAQQMTGALPGLEHPEKTQRRVVECIERAIQRYPGRNLLFVTLGDPMCFLFEYLRGESLEPLVSYPLGVNKATVFMACFEPGIEPDEAVRKLFEPGEYSTVYPRPK